MKYKDRSGAVTSSETSQDTFLEYLYSNVAGRVLLKVLTRPLLSKIAGLFLNSRISTMMIDPFIKKNHIKMSAFLPCRYRSYNEFFNRKLKPGRRNLCADPYSLISPADGKVSAYQIYNDSMFRIKNTYYTVESLVKNTYLAKDFAGGVCVVIRLTVDDYHRYCYAANGTKGENIRVRGVLHTVNPIALKHVKIYKENSREYTVLDTEHFGKVVQMEVGAMMVGKIHNHHQGARVRRGQEKGYFEFGGSSIVLLLQKDFVMVATDLLLNTEQGFETYIKLGEEIGTAIKV